MRGTVIVSCLWMLHFGRGSTAYRAAKFYCGMLASSAFGMGIEAIDDEMDGLSCFYWEYQCKLSVAACDFLSVLHSAAWSLRSVLSEVEGLVICLHMAGVLSLVDLGWYPEFGWVFFRIRLNLKVLSWGLIG